MDKISVVVRVRPLNERERTNAAQSGDVWALSNNPLSGGASISLRSQPQHSYTFDAVFDPRASTQNIYEQCSRDLIASCCEGINATIFAYGQTSSGKTFTMSGDANAPGIISLTITDIFDRIASSADSLNFSLKVSYLEVYNEVVNDLLSPENTNLKIHEHMTRGVHVGGLTEESATCPADVQSIISRGEANRHFGGTNMNERSSRSHTILRILIESHRKSDKRTGIRVSCLNLVDLAGSERAAHTGAEGKRLKEGGSINKSLLALATVIGKLSEKGGDRGHIPYRNSKITRILQPSLGGNARTLIIATVTPSSGFVDETISTLQFASRAKSIRNKPIVNEIVPDDILIKKYREEIVLLKTQLNQIKGSPLARSNTSERLRGESIISSASKFEEPAFFCSDEFRQSYPYDRPASQLNLSSLPLTQIQDMREMRTQCIEMFELASRAKNDLESLKTGFVSHIAGMQARSSQETLTLKAALNESRRRLLEVRGEWEIVYSAFDADRKEHARVKALFEAESLQCNSLREQLIDAERMHALFDIERQDKESVQRELGIERSKIAAISERIQNALIKCCSKFNMETETRDEFSRLLTAICDSEANDSALEAIVALVEGIREGEAKKVYTDLRLVFEEGRSVLLEQIDHFKALLANMREKNGGLETEIDMLRNELETAHAENRRLNAKLAQEVVDRTCSETQWALQVNTETAQRTTLEAKVNILEQSLTPIVMKDDSNALETSFQEAFRHFRLATGEDDTRECAERIYACFKHVMDLAASAAVASPMSCKQEEPADAKSTLETSEQLQSLVTINETQQATIFDLETRLQETLNQLHETDARNFTKLHLALKESEERMAELAAKSNEVLSKESELVTFESEIELLKRDQTEMIQREAAEKVESAISILKQTVESLLEACCTSFQLPETIFESLKAFSESILHPDCLEANPYVRSQFLKTLERVSETQKAAWVEGQKEETATDIVKITQELKEQSEEVRRLHRDLQLAETNLQFAAVDKASMSQSLEAAQKQITTLDSELFESKKIVSTTERKSKKLISSMKELEIQHTRVMAQLSEVEKEHRAVLERYHETQAELEVAKSSQAGFMDEAILVKLQNESAKKSEQLANMEQEYHHIVTLFQTLQSEASTVNNSLARLELEKSHAQQEAESLLERIQEQEQEIEDLRIQDEYMRGRLSIFESSSTGAQGDEGGNTLLSEVEDRRIRSEQQHADMLQTMRRLNREVLQLKRANKELKSQLGTVSNGLSEEQMKEQMQTMAQMVEGLKKRGGMNDNQAAGMNPIDLLDPEAHDLLKLELQRKSMENDELRKENKMLRMIGLNEMGKLRNAEYSISQQGRKVQQTESALLALKDKLAEKEADQQQASGSQGVDQVAIGNVDDSTLDESKENESQNSTMSKSVSNKMDLNIPLAHLTNTSHPHQQLQSQLPQQSNSMRREKAASKAKQVTLDKNEAVSECKTQ
ncbi:hypothetical protein HDU77_007614 [Chytriomyces hyalinus]|nr:hypothetical protein HDU77_007614 [Chytriomyces hyalinus]